MAQAEVQRGHQRKGKGKGERRDVGRRGGGGRRGTRPHDQAARIVTELLRAKAQRSGGASIKSLVYKSDVENKKAVYAICCETLKHLSIIKGVLEESKCLSDLLPKKLGLVYVWVYELLFGQWKKISHFNKFVPVAKQQDKLKEAYERIKSKKGGIKGETSSSLSLSPLESKTFPRYARINTLKLSIDSALSQLKSEYGDENVKKNKYLRDVLELPSSIHLYNHRLIKQGSVVLQGLSSCMPVHALQPTRSMVLIDACSAPGNKTTQLAAHLAANGSPEVDVGKIFAFDLDPTRFQRLCKNVRHCGAEGIVQPELKDFLSVNPRDDEKYKQVRAILLDPSCSGSGTAHSRGDMLLGKALDVSEQSETERRRIDILASFQEKCLRHALNFPLVERVVYSTCSIYLRENETVVASVLAEAERLGFKLEKALPQWPRRGFPLFDACENLVRVDPSKDKTDGFFLALFTRSKATVT